MKRLYVILFLLLFVPEAFGNDPAFEEEVAHLLTFVEQSDCTFFRNGKAYSSIEARAHIDNKYNYIKGRISSAEQFITYGASKSSITGKKYTVDCEGATMTSGQWLGEELAAFRKNRATASGTTGKTSQ